LLRSDNKNEANFCIFITAKARISSTGLSSLQRWDFRICFKLRLNCNSNELQTQCLKNWCWWTWYTPILRWWYNRKSTKIQIKLLTNEMFLSFIISSNTLVALIYQYVFVQGTFTIPFLFIHQHEIIWPLSKSNSSTENKYYRIGVDIILYRWYHFSGKTWKIIFEHTN
jgi:hypothetical protein